MGRLPRFREAGLALAAALLAGCGGEKFHPVSGVVRLDGQPVANAAVTLIPAGPGRPAVGATDAQGRFTLETGNTAGALAGKYTAVVVPVGPSSTDERKPAAPVKDALPARYAKAETSPLKVTVPADGANGYDLQLTGKP